MIKVLMVLTSLTTDGVTSYAMNYYRNMDPQKVRIDFAVFRSDIMVDEIKNEILMRGDHVFVIPSAKHFYKSYSYCKKLLTRFHYDIIHDNTLIISLPLMYAAKNKRIGIRILHSHNSKLGETKLKEFRNRVFLPILRRSSNAYAACSKLAQQGMFGKRKAKIIPNAIDVDRFRFRQDVRDNYRDQMGVNDKTIVISVGRMAPQKNPFFAIDVIGELVKKDDRIEYWWVGDGPLHDEVNEYIKRNGIEKNIRLLGQRLDIAELYMAADCFFLPSIFEGLPVTAIEAQAAGLQCIISSSVTNEVAITDLVKFIPLDGTTEKWVKAIGSLSSPRRELYGVKLKDSAYSNNCAAGSLERYYRRLLSKL